MQDLTKRQEKILSVLVEEYTKTVEPVSSKLLAKKRGLSVSPATIRNEMQELMDKGYIYQPHTSSGRTPTAKAYRFFVDKLQENPLLKNIFEEMGDSDELKYFEQASKSIAEKTANLVLTYLPGRDFVLKEGWESVFQNPEFQEKSFLDRFIEEVEYLEENMRNIVEEDLRVYIGRESPILRSEGFSLIIGNLPEKGIVAILGPERTEYGKSINLIRSLIKSLEDI